METYNHTTMGILHFQAKGKATVLNPNSSKRLQIGVFKVNNDLFFYSLEIIAILFKSCLIILLNYNLIKLICEFLKITWFKQYLFEYIHDQNYHT